MDKRLKRRIIAMITCVIAGFCLAFLAEFCSISQVFTTKSFAIGTVFGAIFVCLVFLSCLVDDDVSDYFNF